MRYEKLTITLPAYLFRLLKKTVPQGKRSTFIAKSVEKEINRYGYPKADILKRISILRDKSKKYRTNITVQDAIQKGRL